MLKGQLEEDHMKTKTDPMENFLSRISQWETLFESPQLIDFTQYDERMKHWDADIMHVKDIITISGSPGITRDLITRMIKFINKANYFFATGVIPLSHDFYVRDEVLQNVKKLNPVAKTLTHEQLRNMVEPTTLTAATILGSGDPGGMWNDTAKLKIKAELPKGNRLIEEIARYKFMINSQIFNFDSDNNIKSLDDRLLEKDFTDQEIKQFKEAFTQRIFSNPIYLIFGDKEQTQRSIDQSERKLNIVKRDKQVYVEATQKLCRRRRNMLGTQKTYPVEITATYQLDSDSSLRLLKVTTSNKREHFNTTLYDKFMEIKAKKAKKDIKIFYNLTEALSDNHLRIDRLPEKFKILITKEFHSLHQAIWKNDQAIEVLKENPKLRTRFMNSYDTLEKRECGLHNEIEHDLNGDDEKSVKTNYLTRRVKHKAIIEIQKRKSRYFHASESKNKALLNRQAQVLENAEKPQAIKAAIEYLATHYEKHNSPLYRFINWLRETFDPKNAPQEPKLKGITKELIDKIDTVIPTKPMCV